MSSTTHIPPVVGEKLHANMHSLLREDRVFPPPPDFAAKAHIRSMAEYEALYQRSVEDPTGFWTDAASELEWFTPFTSVIEGEMGAATWFNGGKLNLSHNCVDRHAKTSPDKVALLWEGEPGEIRRITYAELLDQVQRFANVLKSLGVNKGDRVAIYMGMCPELAIALLGCARIGAVHSVIFGGFAAHAIVDRVNDSQCVAILTQDISFRRGTEVKLKAIVDEALPKCPSIKSVVVYQRGTVKGAPATQTPVTMTEGRDLWWHEAMAKADAHCPAEPMDSEDPLYILYTSGTTGKPKRSRPHDRRLLRRHLPHHQILLRPAPRRRLLLHCRYRLGHRAQLRRLRPAADRHDRPDVRGRTQLARERSLLEDRRRPPGHHLLYRAHGHPGLHQVGRTMGSQALPRQPPPARHRW